MILSVYLPLHAHAYAEEIRICYRGFHPYTFTKNAKPAGISVEIMQEAAHRAGLAVSFREMPWLRCTTGLENGTFQAALDTSPDRKMLTFISSAPTYVLLGAVVTKDSWITTNRDIDRVEQGRIIVQRGLRYPKSIIDAYGDKMREVSTPEIILRSLENGRGDLTLVDMTTFRQVPKELQGSLKFITPPLDVMEIMPGFIKGLDDEVEKLAKAYSAMLDDGTINRIYVEAIGQSYDDVRTQAGH